MLRISTFCFFVNPKFPDFQIPRNLAQAKLGPGWAGLGTGGPLHGVGREGFLGGPGSSGEL